MTWKCMIGKSSFIFVPFSNPSFINFFLRSTSNIFFLKLLTVLSNSVSQMMKTGRASKCNKTKGVCCAFLLPIPSFFLLPLSFADRIPRNHQHAMLPCSEGLNQRVKSWCLSSMIPSTLARVLTLWLIDFYNSDPPHQNCHLLKLISYILGEIKHSQAIRYYWLT